MTRRAAERAGARIVHGALQEGVPSFAVGAARAASAGGGENMVSRIPSGS